MIQNGKTTRLIDEAIQELFKNGAIVVPDQCKLKDKDYRKTMARQFPDTKIFVDPDAADRNKAQFHFKRRLLTRLYSEHARSFLYNNASLIVSNIQPQPENKFI
jgi:hypothetical protein